MLIIYNGHNIVVQTIVLLVDRSTVVEDRVRRIRIRYNIINAAPTNA